MIVDQDDLEYAELNGYAIEDVKLVFDALKLDCVYDIDCLLEDSDVDFQDLVSRLKRELNDKTAQTS